MHRLKLAPIINSSNRPAIYKMSKEGEDDFYFDSRDLPEHEKEFEDMGESGWVLVERVEVFDELAKTLPNYLPSRRHALENAGLVSFGWGYKKK